MELITASGKKKVTAIAGSSCSSTAPTRSATFADSVLTRLIKEPLACVARVEYLDDDDGRSSSDSVFVGDSLKLSLLAFRCKIVTE